MKPETGNKLRDFGVCGNLTLKCILEK